MRQTKTLIVGMVAAVALPFAAFADGDKSSYDKAAAGERYEITGADTSDRSLTDAEIRDIIAQAGAPDANTDVRYMGGSQTAIETTLCCENLDEQIETRTEIEETTTYVDVVSRRDIIQPVKRTLIQPIERRILQGSVEDVTEDMRYEENRLPVIIERDEVPTLVENYIPQVTVENTEEITETYYDVITERDVIQPIERTTVVPVQRRIVRPVTETITNETRYETVRAPLDRRAQPIPETIETLTEDVTTVTEEQITETIVPYVRTRNVYQPLTRTTIQPIERQILRGTTETITEDTRYEEERLPLIVETDVAPDLLETIIPQVTERTVLEVEDVYIDQVTRNIIQPVVVTTIQPVENVLVNERTETITNDTRYEEEILSGIVEDVSVPDTVVNYIPQVTEDYVEERSETYFEAVTQRDIYQPVVRTIIQPIEYRRVNAVKETVTNATRYETVRASLVVLNVGAPCNCN
ncbi:MAG: hypothetical protein QNI84_04010 [Henriciella sp.]|nr:hypothetical protein [Henriciella sp.]